MKDAIRHATQSLKSGESTEVQLGEARIVISKPKPVGGELSEDYPPVTLDDLSPGHNPWLD